jgi:hypothetical protein
MQIRSVNHRIMNICKTEVRIDASHDVYTLLNGKERLCTGK